MLPLNTLALPDQNNQDFQLKFHHLSLVYLFFIDTFPSLNVLWVQRRDTVLEGKRSIIFYTLHVLSYKKIKEVPGHFALSHLSGPIASCFFFSNLCSRILSLHSSLCAWTGRTLGAFPSVFTLPSTALSFSREGNTDDRANTLSAPYVEGSFVKDCIQGSGSVAKDVKIAHWNARSDLGWKQTLSVASVLSGIPTVVLFFFKAGKLAVDRGWAINVGEYKFSDAIKSVVKASDFHFHLFAKPSNVFSVWLLFSV